MSRKRKWTEENLKRAVLSSTSVRQVLDKIGLVQAGGNYNQIKKYIKENNLNIKHFKGRGWNKGLKGIGVPRISIKDILVKNSNFQSFKLKKRLFSSGLKHKKCEDCDWAKLSKDGRLPLELHHVNGDNTDNRIENLKILCPNCHSLEPTHRGMNSSKKSQWRNWYTRNT
jgi:hypothetical protein